MSNAKFRVGDSVIASKFKGGPGWVSPLQDFVGKTVTIAHVGAGIDGETLYTTKESGDYLWPGSALAFAVDAGMAKDMILSADPKVRKGMPITTGVIDYFPLALAEVAKVSKIGNDQHNPGQPLHWEKGLSTDHADCILRHLIDRGAYDTDGGRHSAKLAWRALALLQTELENEAKERANAVAA